MVSSETDPRPLCGAIDKHRASKDDGTTESWIWAMRSRDVISVFQRSKNPKNSKFQNFQIEPKISDDLFSHWSKTLKKFSYPPNFQLRRSHVLYSSSKTENLPEKFFIVKLIEFYLVSLKKLFCQKSWRKCKWITIRMGPTCTSTLGSMLSLQAFV